MPKSSGIHNSLNQPTLRSPKHGRFWRRNLVTFSHSGIIAWRTISAFYEVTAFVRVCARSSTEHLNRDPRVRVATRTSYVLQQKKPKGNSRLSSSVGNGRAGIDTESASKQRQSAIQRDSQDIRQIQWPALQLRNWPTIGKQRQPDGWVGLRGATSVAQ